MEKSIEELAENEQPVVSFLVHENDMNQKDIGWPVNAPMPLWDTNDTVIYLKSTNQMGMPNPLQKVHYTMEDAPAKQQSFAAPALPDRDMSIYATKDDLERMKEDLKHAITSMQGTKGANSNGKSSF